MRYFWFIGLTIISIQAQQPPDERTFLKSQDLNQAINKLRIGYQSSVDTNYAAVQAHLFQKSDESAGISQSNFGGIVNDESNEIIRVQLADMTRHILAMHKLEDLLNSSNKTKTKDLLELDSQLTLHQQLSELQKKLFESAMLLSYHQTIRTHEKASEIKGKLEKGAKP